MQALVRIMFVADLNDMRDTEIFNILSTLGFGMEGGTSFDLENICICCNDCDQAITLFFGFCKIKRMPLMHEVKCSKSNDGIFKWHT